MIAAAGLLGGCAAEELATADDEPNTEAPLLLSLPLDHLYVIDRSRMNDAQHIMIQSLQGILAQTHPRIWVDATEGNRVFLEDLRARHGVTIETVTDPYALVSIFKSEVNGYSLYDLRESSQNVAISLAGTKKLLAVDPSIETAVQAKGLTKKMDLRGKDEPWALTNYTGDFTKGLFAEMEEASASIYRLGDFPISRRAFVFNDGPSTFRQTVANTFGPNAFDFGWRPSNDNEKNLVTQLSDVSAAVQPADQAQNLSALQAATEPDLQQRTHRAPPAAQDGVHYVAFVMSDGDNFGWLTRNFVITPWGEPERGSFNMNWEMAPILADVARSVLRYYQLNATNTNSVRDFFVGGASGNGYMFPSRYPDLQGYLNQMGPALDRSDLHYTSILDDGTSMAVCDKYLDRAEVAGVLFKAYSPYNGFNGAIRWRNGKPCVAFKYMLWEGKTTAETPSGVAAALAAAPRSPLTNALSYSLVTVHTWSTWSGAGPMGAVAKTVAALPSAVKVVTVEELFQRLQANLAPRRLVFQAESPEFSHKMGRATSDGWSASTSLDPAGHMIYGPYTTAVPAGGRKATFRMKIDNNTSNDNLVIAIDVRDATTGTTLITRNITRKAFSSTGTYQGFSVNFANITGHKLEFRAYWYDRAAIVIDSVVVE